MSVPHDPRGASLENTVIDARRLLDYAVSRGLIKDVTIITAITGIEAQIISGNTPDQPAIDAFLRAYNTLSGLTEGVSGISLGPESEKDAKRTSRIYSMLLVILLLLLVPATTITLVGKRLIDDTLADIVWICTAQESLECSEQTFQKATSPSPNDASPVKTTFQYGASVRTFQILGRMRKVAIFVLYREDPPKWDETDMQSTFRAIRYYADDVRTDFSILYDTVAGTLLPIFFAALGAVTFGLRDLRQRLEARTWVPQGTALPFLRVIIAAAAGFMLSLFSDFSAKSGLTPIALAFIIGYSVDVFFTFIDSIVLRFKTPITTPPRPGGI